MLFPNKDLIYLDFLCSGKAQLLTKQDMKSGLYKSKLAQARATSYDFLPMQFGSNEQTRLGWRLVDVLRSDSGLVFSDNLAIIQRNDTFLNLLKLLVEKPKLDLLLILDEHQNLKGVLNKYDITNLYFVSRVYMSMHVLEVLGYFAISLTDGGLTDLHERINDSKNESKSWSHQGNDLISLLEILQCLTPIQLLRKGNLYFLPFPSKDRSIQFTNKSIYELRNNTMHPRVSGQSSFKIDSQFLRDYSYVENAIIDIYHYCLAIYGETALNRWIADNI